MFWHHWQFHRPRGGPYKCPHCSYNVTRRHLLNQHLAVHGQGGEEDQQQPTDQFVSDEETAEEELLLLETDAAGPSGTVDHLNLEPGNLVKLSDAATAGLADIPLVWVSRGAKFFKMFKCRHCPHVNVRKANILEHEKRHSAGPAGQTDNLHACAICNYRCNNAGVLSAHVKVHQNVLGIVHGLADPSKTDQDQLRALVLPDANDDAGSSSGDAPQPNLDLLLGKDDEGGLHFCAHCPARFVVEAELMIHQRFHGPVQLAYRCDVCSYTARQEAHLLAHWKVHSSDYQERTQVLVQQHGISAKHPQPRIQAVHPAGQEEDQGAMDLTASAQCLSCPLCPAKFGRESRALLRYHSTLHGGDGPFKCRHCDYAVKAQDNLTKHERLHETAKQQRFQCPKCPSSFDKKDGLKDHVAQHGAKAKYRCDHCDYAVKHYANLVQHAKVHTGDDPVAQPTSLSTADRQAVWLQEKLQKSSAGQAGEVELSCQYCPFKTGDRQELGEHTGNHACVQPQLGEDRFRCNFCDYAVPEQSDLSEHIQLHFQLKGRTSSKLPESYWKCSNLEIWSEPVAAAGSGSSCAQLVFNEKKSAEVEVEDDEDALYIDLNTGQPIKDDSAK